MNRDKTKKNDSSQSGTSSPAEPDLRDPAVIRAERFRTEGMRETAEALVVAFILALLFRAFIAEAFVIPTGSMAPTLMGAHKDVFCDRCNQNFPIGASLERRESRTSRTVVGGVCPNCRHVNAMDLADNSDHQTFNGDRILVSKFAYTLADPERFDVIVFKFPGNPKQNYIKRLVGLPDETLTVRHGDIYTRPNDADETDNTVVRKPASTLLAMSHHVYDTDFQSQALIDAKYPSRWQPWSAGATEPPTDSWNVKRDSDGFEATVTAAQGPQWLRYFHRWPSQTQWDSADDGTSLADVDPYSSRLITDFYAYNSVFQVPTTMVYDLAQAEEQARRGRGLFGLFGKVTSLFSGPNVKFNPSYQSGESPEQFGRRAIYGSGQSDMGPDGMHWVGDLICEADVETDANCKQLILELIESGVQFQCRIDLADGKATWSIQQDSQTLPFLADTSSPTATTSLRGGSRHQVRFSNCDDELLLWVDDELVTFDNPTTYDSRTFLTPETDRPHYAKGKHPLDASPVGIAIDGGKGTVHRLNIDRDKYYIATEVGYGEMQDYDMERNRRLGGGGGLSEGEIQTLFGQPDVWADLAIWQARRSITFTMEEDQFFPMGDNSPASLDARCWAGSKLGSGLPPRISEHAYAWADADYVPRDLLVGKALMVFWPHPWSSPVPMTPNFKRFKLIR